MGDKLSDAIGPALRRSFDDTPVHLTGVPRVVNRLVDKKRGDRDGVRSIDNFDGPAGSQRRRGVDRGDGRDYAGTYARGQEVRPWDDKEKIGLDQYASRNGVDVIRTKVKVDFEGSPQRGRTYDGLVRNNDGPNAYTGVEVKSGSAVDRYGPTNTQWQFDEAVNAGTPARGRLYGVDIIVTRVRTEEVP